MIEELAGQGIDRVLQFLHRRRIKGWLPEGEPFETSAVLKRLTGLASMVAGRELRVVDLKGDVPPRAYLPVLYKMAHPSILPDHGYSWTDGQTLYLPVKMAEMETGEAQLDLVKLIVFFLSSQSVSGMLDEAAGNRAELEADPILKDIFWIIENTRISHGLRASYPGLFADWPDAAAHLLSRRPPMGLLTRAEKKVEAFLRSSVEETTAGYESISTSAPESMALARALRREFSEAGCLKGRYRAIVPFVPWGKLVLDRLGDGPSAALKKRGAAGSNDEPGEKDGGEKAGKGARFAARNEDVDEAACEQGLALNIYDKLLSWAEFLNVHRPFDDDPDEEAGRKAEEMDELATAPIERQTSASFDAELEKRAAQMAEEDTEDTPDEAFVYPEWDFKKKVYRPGYVQLRELVSDEGSPGFAREVLSEKRGVIKEVTRQFEVLTPEMRRKKRQLDGEDIDIDAAVEAFVDMEAGLQPDERFYSTLEKTERDIAALFLVDLSMSTDAWVGEKKVIEHEKESLVVLAEALEKVGDRYSLYGFSGKGRKACKTYRIKGFDERYADPVRSRIGGLIPHEYTRMGPAIRHATGILERESARVRLLFILSDGKPNDIDVYEGRYGIEDTRMAVKEAEREGIVPFCLTVESGPKEYLPRIFGSANYAVVAGVDRLVKKLPELYARVSAGL